ncbi:hypothetical protein ACFZDJ_17665 [Streptomyces sp. NPDC007896]|uniref:hypothetical protein n=1 Tax=Streptomyces sp. NPDC007896 TaxID=3364784 RepID=UPI0036EFD99D
MADPDILRGVLISLKPTGRTIAEDVMLRISTSFCLTAPSGKPARDTTPGLSADDVHVVLSAFGNAHD